jgi:hypothetical protein
MFFILVTTRFFVWLRRLTGLPSVSLDNLITTGATLLGKVPDDDNSLQRGNPD